MFSCKGFSNQNAGIAELFRNHSLSLPMFPNDQFDKLVYWLAILSLSVLYLHYSISIWPIGGYIEIFVLSNNREVRVLSRLLLSDRFA